MYKTLALIVAVSLLSACTITQNVEPAQLANQHQLCIIENPKVREGFLAEYRAALTDKGIAHQVVSANSVPDSCEWTSTYTASWSWDMALYMSYADIKVYHRGVLDGEAVYDSRRGGGNMGKFIDAEEKVRELVNELIQIEMAGLWFLKVG
ncbi:Sbal_3080 family lipoprotein [Pseudomaricurvus sp.]|uniref:Sbal_3080 family lipoprotein n=1 Tax=Pseudomaricurvus sp. TaxID=2004510 RepID=UPI003F6D5352